MTGPRRPRIADEIWDSHKPTIERLYMLENRPLTAPGGVRDTMAEQHGFRAS